jgi:predicted RNase H-like nuclease (RuvC/YqgF family)
MGAIEFVVDHLAEVLKAYEGEPGHDEAFRKLQDQFPGLSSELSFASFKQYAGIVLRLNKKINILAALNTDKQLNKINKPDTLNSLLNSDENDKQKINNLIEMLNTAKHEVDRLTLLNSELNKTVEKLNSQINNSELINSDKQNSDDDKQTLNILQEQLNTAKQEIELLNSKLNKGDTMIDDKQKINISGWSIQKSGGFYRAFRRIKGKMQGVYIGKSLDEAESKIRVKEQALQGMTP